MRHIWRNFNKNAHTLEKNVTEINDRKSIQEIYFDTS